MPECVMHESFLGGIQPDTCTKIHTVLQSIEDNNIFHNPVEAWDFLFHFFFQALKMPYCSNKPVPTPGHLLPRPNMPGPAASKKEEETSLKRKIFDSMPDAGDGPKKLFSLDDYQ